jgi:hypothetical protein
MPSSPHLKVRLASIRCGLRFKPHRDIEAVER